MIYFDYAATCPLNKKAADAYLRAATQYFGNSSSLHDYGNNAASLLESCRKRLSTLLGVPADGLFFTSGGTESNYLAIQALLSSRESKGNHIISGMAEHSSISGTIEKLKEEGYRVTLLKFNDKGVINLDEFAAAIQEDTVLVVLQHGNSEIGTLQPLKEIHSLLKGKGILFHSDCVHSFGKVDLKEITPYIDSLSISGHKIYGPKGVGAVYISPQISWKPFYNGATHEKGLRPGTVNVPAIVAMTVAAEELDKERVNHFIHYETLRDKFIRRLSAIESELVIYDFPERQLPSTIGLRIRGIEGQWMMLQCNRLGFAISTGSACQVGMQSPSKTMQAMGVEGKEAKEFIRVSLGIETTEVEIEQLAEAIVQIKKEANVRLKNRI